METSDKFLMVLLLLAVAAFPVAVFLYLRTAYRRGGWGEVKSATFVALAVVAIVGAFRLWIEWESRHIVRFLEHPFALGSILFVLLMFLGHWILTLRAEETDDHH